MSYPATCPKCNAVPDVITNEGTCRYVCGTRVLPSGKIVGGATCFWNVLIAEAVAAERERCAKIAESYGGSKFEYECVGREIARMIRREQEREGA